MEMHVENLLPWHVYLSEYWELQDIHQHYEYYGEVGVHEDDEEEDFSSIKLTVTPYNLYCICTCIGQDNLA